jgi:hypothetical protein
MQQVAQRQNRAVDDEKTAVARAEAKAKHEAAVRGQELATITTSQPQQPLLDAGPSVPPESPASQTNLTADIASKFDINTVIVYKDQSAPEKEFELAPYEGTFDDFDEMGRSPIGPEPLIQGSPAPCLSLCLSFLQLSSSAT